MSVLCCRVPDFLIGLAERQEPKWMGRPLALLDANERVSAASPEARLSGVAVQMSARQAQMRCPDVLLSLLDTAACQQKQSAFVGTLAECGLPVEAQTWGVAYVDLREVARTGRTVQPICAEMGKQVRRLLGDTLAPSLGWDTGKFIARAASSCARPGHMRLVEHSDEERFLNPLSITLLPLPELALQQLTWLGITTLGQFARLPATAVWQRFGQAGKLAQQWARGRDDRSVSPTATMAPQPVSVDFDPPTALHTPVLEAALSALRSPLSSLAHQLQGCRRLRLDLRFVEGSTRVIDCTFVEPVSEESRVRATVSHQLQILEWPAELETLRVTLLETGELVARQLTLFEIEEESSPLVELARQLSRRYGERFFQPRLVDERHPLPERRFLFSALASCSTV